MVYRILGALTAVASMAVIGVVLVAAVFVGPASRLAADVVAPVAILVVLLGLATMIVHLNVSGRLSREEKSSWRQQLWWAGPFAAAAYLWSIPGSRATRLSDGPDQASGGA